MCGFLPDVLQYSCTALFMSNSDTKSTPLRSFASYSPRKFSMVVAMGFGDVCPNPHRLMALTMPHHSASSARSDDVPFPDMIFSSRCLSIMLPALQGVHHPHDSSTKNSMKLWTISRRARFGPMTMRDPPVGSSSKESFFPKSFRPTHLPDGPPTCTAMASDPPDSFRMLCSVLPNSNS